jgi:hypothetical protein
MEWRFFPEDTLMPYAGARIGKAMRTRLIWWPNWMNGQIGVLDTATFQFSLMNVPTPLTTENTIYASVEDEDEDGGRANVARGDRA